MARGIKQRITFLTLAVAVGFNAVAQTTVTNSLKLRIQVHNSEDVREYEFDLSPGVAAGVIDPQSGEFYPNLELLNPTPDELKIKQFVSPQE